MTAFKIKITVVKDSKRVYTYPSYQKMRNFANSEAKLTSIFDSNGHIVIFVDYGNGFTNEKVCFSQEDLKWCFAAFLQEYL